MERERKDIRTIAKKYEKVQTVMCYVDKESLMKQFRKEESSKASGVDQVTKEEYGKNLERNIENLLRRMKQFSYRPQPVRRVYIPKGNGKLRPLGIPSFEDKLVQGCMAYPLNEIYETKFLDFSYGFRENRNCHMAIEEINNHIMKDRVNYILDCDIKGFFDNVDHKWLMKFLEHDIGDKNFLRYIARFLKSGIMEDLKYYESDKGTPQGGLISPILANVYLHYVLDLWFEHIKKTFHGEMYLIRYADDFVVLFQYENEAKKFYELVVERLAKFELEVATDKTRILPFGRYKGNKETFDFLGFEFHNGRTIEGKYRTHIITSRKKLKQKRKSTRQWIKEHRHMALSELLETINRKLVGHYNYYGINGNYESLVKFYKYVKYTTYKWLNRRDQKGRFSYVDFLRVWNFYVGKPKVKVNIWHWQCV